AKEDIMSMIESLKSDAEKEPGFDRILTDIESNEDIAPFVSDISKSDDLTKDFAPEKEPQVPVQSAPAKAPGGIDTDSAEFADELAALLGDKPAPQAEATAKTDGNPVVNIPEETAQENGFVFDLLPGDGQRTVGVVPDEIIEDDGKITRKDRQRAKRETAELSGKKYKGDIIRRIVLAVSIIVILVSSAILANTYILEPYKYKKNETAISDTLDKEVTGTVDEIEKDEDDDTEYPSGMLAKYRKLFKVNSDLKGWISIPALEINLPIAQASDNDYYLHRNIYKKWTNYGVPFYDYRIEDLKNLPKNTVIYGHNMHYDDLIFGMLENYREPEGFKSAPVIECNTIYGDHVWFVYAAFITNSAPSQDNGYVFPYNFIDISEQKFAEYIQEVDKRKFYTTGVDIAPTDKILTLSTCCYDFEGGRLVIVARLKRDGESDTVDTSRVVVNSNPKYPQAWYNANKKTNPYANDPRW
ncbi:MAG: class B sortase, partial [Clostridia bacterium]|nr:class B sortase [Clostridia bacterium]